MTRFSAWLGRLFEALAVLAALILLAMVVLVTADILLRNMTRTGFPWANEITEYGLYIVTLLSAPWLLRRGQHVRIDLVVAAVPARVGFVMEALADILGFLVCLVLMRYAVRMTIDSAMLGSITVKNLVFPEWWLLWPLPVCFALLATEFCLRFERLLRTGQRPETTRVG